ITQVEKKAQPYLPFIPISGNLPHRKSTLELHGTATDPNYGISPMWGSSLGPGVLQPYPLTKPCHLLLLCTFFSPLPNSHFTPPEILLMTQSTFSSVTQPVDSQHTHHYISDNQPTIIYSFRMTKPSKHTFIYSHLSLFSYHTTL